jgi:DNA-binding transcriptional MerR regulator
VRIGELAGVTGVSTRSLRYYEEQCLLPVRRRTNGYREYDGGRPAGWPSSRTSTERV